MITEVNVKQLSMLFAEHFFVKKDYSSIFEYLNDNVIWIDSCINMIFTSKNEVREFLLRDSKKYDDIIDFKKTKYSSLFVSEEVCNVAFTAEITNITSIDCHEIKCTQVWKKNVHKERWELVHIHNSMEETQNDDVKSNSKIDQISKHIVINRIINTDLLTNINNEKGFEQDVKRILEKYQNYEYAIIKIGIENFRFINKRYGFDIGDEILRSIANNLVKSLKDKETCGRIEKDNFAMLYRVDSKASLDKRLFEIRETIIDRRILEKIDFEVNLRGGVYIISDKNEYIKDILDKALMAMQSIKHISQINRPIYYEDWMLVQQYYNSKILEEAQRAIKNDEFEIYIQPQFDVRKGKVISGEILARWKLDDGTIRMPNDFIPIFEQYGTILAFDYYMLDKTCQLLKGWIDQEIEVLPISINQSRIHIRENNYLSDFCNIVDKHKIDHRYIIFELTETAFIEDSAKMIKFAKNLQEYGFQLAIDDFGSGYASINMLAEISANILKIDRVLINDCRGNHRSRVIIKMIVDLAHELDMKVIAEGIEDEEQLMFLKSINCDIGQGYLVGRPIPEHEFKDMWLNKNREGIHL